MKKPKPTPVLAMVGHHAHTHGDWTYHLTDGKTWLL